MPADRTCRERDFVQMILENLKTAGVQQAHKEDKNHLHSLSRPGRAIWSVPKAAISRVVKKRARETCRHLHRPGVRHRLPPRPGAAAREAGDADFDVLIACAFNYDAHSSEFDKLGRIPCSRPA